MAAVQSESPEWVVDIAHHETGVVGHHSTFFRGLDGDGPFGVVAACREVGTRSVTNHFARGIREGVAIVGYADRPIIVAFHVRDGCGENLVTLVGSRGEQHARGLARRLVAHGVVVGGVFVEACSENHIAAFRELAQIADADIFAFWCGWGRWGRLAARHFARDINKQGVGSFGDGINLFAVSADFKTCFHAHVNVEVAEMA